MKNSLLKPVLILNLCIPCLLSFSFGSSEKKVDMNGITQEVIKTYPTDGSYKYSWPKPGSGADGKDPYDGVTQDIFYMGQKVLKGDGKKSSYCCGLTLEVFLKSIDKYNKTHGSSLQKVNGTPESYTIAAPVGRLNAENFSDFKYHWYCPTATSAGPGEALTTYGMGTMVTDWEQAKKGDFVQIWRWNGSGHSVVFVDWIKDSTNNITGFKYWSSQGKTGIAYNTEYFGTSGKTIDKKRTYISRVTEPTTWK